MAIFLLLYLIFLLAWVVWALVLNFHLAKYHFPGKFKDIYIISFWLVHGLILLLSIVFIIQADWRSVPRVF